MEQTFGEWLSKKLDELDISQAELSRRAKIDSGVISNLITGKRNAGVDSCKAIARALKISLAETYRAAGIMPPEPDADPTTETIVNLVLELDNEEKREILEYVKLRHRISTDKKLERESTASKRAPRRTAAT